MLYFWMLVQIVSIVFPLHIAAGALIVVLGLFLWIHWIRPKPFKRRRGPADMRLRPVHRNRVIWLAAHVAIACLAIKAMYLLHLRVFPAPAEDPFAEMLAMADEPCGSIVLILMAVVIAPIVEETVFRGWIQRPLERVWGTKPAIMITALLFSGFHLVPEYIPYYFIVGAVLGGVVVITQSLWPSIALHAALNFQALTLTFIGAGDLAQEITFAHAPTTVVVSVIVLAASVVFLHKTVHHLQSVAARPRIAARTPFNAMLSG